MAEEKKKLDVIGLLWSVLWFFCLWFVAWPVGFLMAWIYVILIPFSACIPEITDVCEIILRFVKLPLLIAIFMLEQKRLFGEGSEDGPGFERLYAESNKKSYDSTGNAGANGANGTTVTDK